MKTLLVSLLAVAQLSAFEYGLIPSKVSEKIYCYYGKPEAMNKKNNGNMVNTCFVDMGKAWIAIDSGPTYAYAKEAYTKIEKIKKQPLAYVINTHIHDDHWLGNAFYKEIGTTIVGSETFTTEINPREKTRMQNRITPLAYEKTTIVFPTQMISHSIDLKVDGKSIKLQMLMKKAHTSRDIIITIPSAEVVFAGDLIFSDRIPSLRGGDINYWLEALALLEAKESRYLIGGHGSVTNKHATSLTRAYLSALKTAVKAAIEEGEDIDSAVKNIELEAFRNRPMYEALHKANVDAAYRVLEWADE